MYIGGQYIFLAHDNLILLSLINISAMHAWYRVVKYITMLKNLLYMLVKFITRVKYIRDVRE